MWPCSTRDKISRIISLHGIKILTYTYIPGLELYACSYIYSCIVFLFSGVKQLACTIMMIQSMDWIFIQRITMCSLQLLMMKKWCSGTLGHLQSVVRYLYTVYSFHYCQVVSCSNFMQWREVKSSDCGSLDKRSCQMNLFAISWQQLQVITLYLRFWADCNRYLEWQGC